MKLHSIGEPESEVNGPHYRYLCVALSLSCGGHGSVDHHRRNKCAPHQARGNANHSISDTHQTDRHVDVMGGIPSNAALGRCKYHAWRLDDH